MFAGFEIVVRFCVKLVTNFIYLQALTLLYSITLCILIKRRRSRNQQNRDVHVGAREVIQQNNVGSRHLLL